MEAPNPPAAAAAAADGGRDDEYAAIFRSLPPVDFAFAYGSGVFKQAGYDGEQQPGQQRQPGQQQQQDYGRLPMLDLVLAVKSPTEWHAANLQRNPGHYSVLRWLGPEAIARIQGRARAAYSWCCGWKGGILCGLCLCACLSPPRH